MKWRWKRMKARRKWQRGWTFWRIKSHIWAKYSTNLRAEWNALNYTKEDALIWMEGWWGQANGFRTIQCALNANVGWIQCCIVNQLDVPIWRNAHIPFMRREIVVQNVAKRWLLHFIFVFIIFFSVFTMENITKVGRNFGQNNAHIAVAMMDEWNADFGEIYFNLLYLDSISFQIFQYLPRAGLPPPRNVAKSMLPSLREFGPLCPAKESMFPKCHLPFRKAFGNLSMQEGGI